MPVQKEGGERKKSTVQLRTAHRTKHLSLLSPSAARRPKGIAAEIRPLLLPTTTDAAASDAPEPYTIAADLDTARVDMPRPYREAGDVDISNR